MRSRKIIYIIKCLCFIALIIHVFSAHISRAAVVAAGAGLSADPLSLTIPLGDSRQSIITVSGKGNPAPWPVDLSASSISGVSTLFDPEQVTIQTNGGDWHYNQSTLTINVGISAALGVVNLTVIADFGMLTRTVNITLTIVDGGSWDEPVRERAGEPVGGIIVQDGDPLNSWIYAGLTVPAATVAAINFRRRLRIRGSH